MSFQPPSSSFPQQRNESSEGSRRRAFIEIPGYEIEREIGRGGMATVYLAIQQSLGRQVALKVLALEPDTDDDFSQRFNKEGRILAQLVHPNIVTIYDISITDDHYFFSMEYLPGGTLKQRIRQGLSLESAVQITRSIAKALGYAHEKGVVHRDIKPFNILFRQDDTPILTDFGVARVAESKTINTLMGSTIGSPGYMSPEQARGEIATTQSDLYSLGVVVYEMLVGRPPYEADNAIAVALKHLYDPIPKLPKECSYFQPVIDKLLAKKNSDRYKNANEFLDAFDAAIPGSGVGSLPRVKTSLGSVSVAEFTNGKLRALLDTNRKWRFPVLGALIAIAVIVVAYSLKVKRPVKDADISRYPQLAEQTKEVRRKQEVSAALKRAESQLQAKLLSGDSEDSAESLYRHALKLEPGNVQALTGLQNIATEYEKQAQNRFDAGALQEGLNYVNQGLAVAPAHEGLMHLRREIERRFAEMKAEQTRQEEQRQRQLQAEQFLMQAQSSFREGAWEVTLAHIEQGLLAIPDHRDLLALREQVKVRLAEQVRQQAEAQRRREEEARRQAEIVERQKAEQTRRLQEAEQYLGRALEDQRNGQYAAGLQQIEKGLALVPDHAQSIRLREEMRAQLAAEQKRQAEQAKREQDIAALLKQADAQWKTKQWIEPAGNNAVATYREVLKLDPDNAPARDGLGRIAQEYERQARQQRDAGALQESLAQIEKGLTVLPNHEGLAGLRQEVERGIAEAKAQQAREEAQRLQADHFFTQAQSSFRQGTLEEGLHQIEQGLTVSPSHPGLLTLREQVKAQLAEQSRQQAEAQRRREEEAQRQAELAERQKAEQARQEEVVQRRREEALWQAEEAERRRTEKAWQQAEAARRLKEADLYLTEVLEKQQGGQYVEGLRQIEKGLALVPNHAELIRLRDEIGTQLAAEQKRQAEQAKREQKIAALLKQADVQWKRKQLTEPAGNNAEATYRQVLELDAKNAPAQAGLSRIAQEYLQQARQRQSAGAFQESLKQIDKGLAVVPNQEELLRLREEVHTQFAGERQKLEQQRLEQQQRETQRQEQEQQKKLEQQKEAQRQQEEKQQKQQQKQQKEQKQQKRQQDQQRKEQQRLEQQQQEQQKKLEQQQRQEEKLWLDQQRREQQRLEQQRQQERQREQQKKLEQQRLQEKEQLEQKKRIEQQRLEQQRQEQQPPKQSQPETTTKPRVFGTF